jgi:hypothetical protein
VTWQEKEPRASASPAANEAPEDYDPAQDPIYQELSDRLAVLRIGRLEKATMWWALRGTATRNRPN